MLDRPADQPRRERQHDELRIERVARAEIAADVLRRDDPHQCRIDPERCGKLVAHHDDADARGGVEREPAGHCIMVGRRASRLHVHPRDALDMAPEGDPVGSPGEGGSRGAPDRR